MELTLTGASLRPSKANKVHNNNNLNNNSSNGGGGGDMKKRDVEQGHGTTGGHDHDHCDHDDGHPHPHPHNHNPPIIMVGPMRSTVAEQAQAHGIQPPESTQDAVQRLVAAEGVAGSRARYAALLTAVKVGTYPVFEVLGRAMVDRPELREELYRPWPPEGHTLVHWAAKRAEDSRFVQFLVEHSSDNTELTMATTDTGMVPLHWACGTTCPSSYQQIEVVSLLLQACMTTTTTTLHAKDHQGNTPLILAAQHGHADLCAYLIQRGAVVTDTDTSHDHALHWAAYKGSQPVVGLLLHHNSSSGGGSSGPSGQIGLDDADKYGQTPLHLASLRGNAEVVHYLLEEASKSKSKQPSLSLVRKVLFLRDHKGQTPRDLAMKKNHPSCIDTLTAWEDRIVSTTTRPTLRTSVQQLVRVWTRYVRPLGSIYHWKLWFGMAPEFNTDGVLNVGAMQANLLAPFVFLVGMCLFMTVFHYYKFVPLLAVETGLLWEDCGLLHAMSAVTHVVGWTLFFLTLTTDPGSVDTDPSLQRHYDTCLESPEALLSSLSIHNNTNTNTNTNNHHTKPTTLPLCHSCHILRPPRSKHCRVLRKCVLMYDHYCPFVKNAIGLRNYVYFYGFLWTLLWGQTCFLVTWARYTARSPTIEWGLVALAVLVSLTVIPAASLAVYHTRLIAQDLTTNEHQNLHRYTYLQHPHPTAHTHTHTHHYYNPWVDHRRRQGAYSVGRRGPVPLPIPSFVIHFVVHLSLRTFYTKELYETPPPFHPPDNLDPTNGTRCPNNDNERDEEQQTLLV